MSNSAARLYEEDFVRWTEEQSSALRDAARNGTNLPLDWENLAEEVESSGRSQRHELRAALWSFSSTCSSSSVRRRPTQGAGGWRRLLASDPISSWC